MVEKDSGPESQTPAQAGFDPDYIAWRAEQLAQYDRDYACWRECQARQHDERYLAWRAGQSPDPAPWKPGR